VAIAGGHTEVTPAVNRVVISCTAIGRVSPSQLVVSNLARPGDSLLLSKTAGVEGTLILLADFAERLGADILALRSGLEAELMAKLSVGTEARLAAANGAHAMHDVTEGGVLGAAVELGTAAGTGVVVYKNAIPLHPVTRIVCEAIEVDAYHLISSGSLMCAVPDEQVQQVLSAWRGAGINGAVIGRITNEPGAFFEDEDGRVAITDPEKDALWDVRS
jgi:hydrogenase maturation factor